MREEEEDPYGDLYVKAPESGGTILESPSIHLVDKKWGLRDQRTASMIPSQNFRHRRCKRHNTMTLTKVGGSLKDDFFDDIEGFSIELANIDKVVFVLDFLSPLFLI